MKLSTIHIMGQCLLWLGFLGGAFVSVVRLEDSVNPWQTIPWTPYALSALVGTVGVVLLRADKATQRSESAASESGLDAVTENLKQAAELVAQLSARLQDVSCEEVLEFIDGQCAPVLSDFSDGRMVIADRYGTAAYATVMTEFASGERYLNRAWSAAADGYVDEVELSVQHASTFLSAAVAHLQQAAA